MNKLVELAASMIIGAAIGSSMTYICLNKKYKKRSDDEIASYRELKDKEVQKHLGLKDKVYEKPAPEELAEKYKKQEPSVNDILHKYGLQKVDDSYIDLTKARQEMEARKSIQEALKERGDIPYEITEDEFGEFEDYTPISLTRYSDGLVADERDILLDDKERIIGTDWEDHFDTICYIRNDALKCDYEIVEDPRTYREILDAHPYLRMEL